jgi:RimJ/RimL family protein N-acetyltransferase
MPKIIETSSLILRTWETSDIKAYYKINQDPKVTEFLPSALTLKQVKDFIERMKFQQQNRFYSLWATELKRTREFMGFIGLNYTEFPAHFTPAVEVGWRLGSQYWGNGYATEGALASLDYGFNNCNLKKIVSFTVPANLRSIRVMEKVGLNKDINGDFAHPKLPVDHPLSQHVLYRLTKDEFLKGTKCKIYLSSI